MTRAERWADDEPEIGTREYRVEGRTLRRARKKNKRGISQQKFDRQARVGDFVPSYRDRDGKLRAMGFACYADYLDSALWTGIRARVRVRDKNTCRLCNGKSESVHHLSYDEQTLRGLTLDWLICICVPCHRACERKPDGTKRTPREAFRSTVARLIRNGWEPPAILRATGLQSDFDGSAAPG